jgi:uncharacterized protein YijF (DUF1287 family)
MTAPTGQFKIGDMVREKLPSGSGEIGIVVERHEWSGEHRFVVKFNSGEEGVFFGNELILDGSAS